MIPTATDHERTTMRDEFRIEDMSAQEIAELLAAEGDLLSADQAAAIRDFVEKVGGIENAWLAIDMLSQLPKVA